MEVLAFVFLVLLFYVPALMIAWYGIFGSTNPEGHQTVLWLMVGLGVPLAWLLVSLNGASVCQGGSLGFVFWMLLVLGGVLLMAYRQIKQLVWLYLGRLCFALAPTTVLLSFILTGFC